MRPENIGNTPKTPEVPKKDIGHKINMIMSAETLRKSWRKLGQKICSVLSGETIADDNYLLSDHLILTKKQKKGLGKTIKIWDKIDITMSNELGSLIEEKVKSPDYRFGVHRSYFVDSDDPKNDDALQSIMQNGLYVFGDASSGAVRKDADPSKTVSFCDSLLNAVILTKSSRQGSNGAVLVAIPSKFVDENGKIIPGKEKDVYNYGKGGFPSIKPEYILGFAPGGGRHGAHIKFVSRQEILNSSDAPQSSN